MLLLPEGRTDEAWEHLTSNALSKSGSVGQFSSLTQDLE